MDMAEYLRFVMALAAVLGLILALAWLVRRYGGRATGHRLARGHAPRLGIVETRSLDPRHRLVLVQRDGREHLLLLGPGNATVVETGITDGERPPQQLAREESE